MKKATMNAIVSFIDAMDAQGSATQEAMDARAEIVAELAKDEAKAQANRDLYAEAHDIVMGALSETPVTISELYEEIADRLPDGFSKGKVQYAVTRLWTSEIAKVEGKINGYTRKA